MKRLKVLFVTTWYPTKEDPVGGVFVREHAKAVNLYDDVVVIHSMGRPPRTKRFWSMEKETDESLTESIPTFRLYYRRFPIPKTKYLNNLFSTLKVFDHIWFFKAFDYILSLGFRPDIIHLHHYDAGIPCILIGKIRHIPVVVTEHSTAFPRKMLSRFEIIKAKLIFRNARFVFPVSYALQKAIESYGIRAKFQVIPNAVNTSVFYPPAHPKQISDPKKILFVALLGPVKGISILFQALALLRQWRDDWQLDIMGDGPARIEYEQAAATLQIADRITFHGVRSKKEIAEFMRRADFFVLPSLFETFSVVTAEALATGTPVLATRCGGPEEFVNDRVGLLVAPGDSVALCRGLNYMLDHLDRFIPDELSRYAAECFNQGNVGAHLHAFYRQLLGVGRKSFNVGYSGERVFIEEGWRVLDVGSGHNPHSRADFLLEKELQDHTGRSGKAAVRDGRPLILGDAQHLPFKDKSFDYVIASQIAEHVPKPSAFCEELQRVASRGYIECPGPVGEKLLGEPFHLWIVKKENGRLIFSRKAPNNSLLQLVSDLFYALFYLGRERSRPTMRPRSWIQRQVLSRLSFYFLIIWRSKWLRRWTYTCFEFNKSFDFRVIEDE